MWVGGITHLPLANGDWAYRCAFQDMASTQEVGWQVGAHARRTGDPCLATGFLVPGAHAELALASRWLRLKTAVFEVRERPLFTDLADAQASVADYLTTTITSDCTPALVTIRLILLINSFFHQCPSRRYFIWRAPFKCPPRTPHYLPYCCYLPASAGCSWFCSAAWPPPAPSACRRAKRPQSSHLTRAVDVTARFLLSE